MKDAQEEPKKIQVRTWIFAILSIIAVAFLVLVIFAKDIFGDPNNPFILAFATESSDEASSLISRFFIKATPHNGIEKSTPSAQAGKWRGQIPNLSAEVT